MSSVRRLCLSLVLTTLACHAWPALASPPEHPPEAAARALLKEVEGKLQGLRTFTSAVDADLSLPLLPTLHLQGTVYYRAPHQVRVAINNLPRIVERFRQSFSSLSPRYTSGTDYRPERLPPDEGELPACERICLHALRAESNLQTITLWIDRERTVPRTVLEYADGSVVDSRTTYRDVGSYRLPDVQDTELRLPAFRARAHATYRGYRLNAPIAAEVFSERAEASPGEP